MRDASVRKCSQDCLRACMPRLCALCLAAGRTLTCLWPPSLRSALEKVQSRAVSYEEQVSAACAALLRAHRAWSEHASARGAGNVTGRVVPVSQAPMRHVACLPRARPCHCPGGRHPRAAGGAVRGAGGVEQGGTCAGRHRPGLGHASAGCGCGPCSVCLAIRPPHACASHEAGPLPAQAGRGRGLPARAAQAVAAGGASLPIPFQATPGAYSGRLRTLPPHLPPAEYKLAKNIKIAMLYLEDDDAVAAETYIKKASSLLSSCKVGPTRGGWGLRGGLANPQSGRLGAPAKQQQSPHATAGSPLPFWGRLCHQGVGDRKDGRGAGMTRRAGRLCCWQECRDSAYSR